MIMTKEKVRELNAMTSGRMAATETMPLDGTYSISTTQDADVIRKSSETANTDYFIMGMVIPAHKAAAVCQLLQDDHGMMPSPVIMLKKSGSAASTSMMSRVVSTPALANRGNVVTEKTIMHDESIVNIKDIEIIPGRHEVKVKGKLVVLTFSEFRILHTLASKPGWVFSRDKIIHAVHGNDYNCTERAVDVQVTGLRKKLGAAGDNIETVRGVGYRFTE